MDEIGALPCDAFGIRKVVDCKVEGGKQMYKVEWQATWEPAESLVICQNLVDEFWSHVNKAKAHEQVAKEQQKRVIAQVNQTGSPMNPSIGSLTEDDKADLHKLTSQTNATSVGANILSPSVMLGRSPQGLQDTSNMKNSNRLGNNSSKSLSKAESMSLSVQLESRTEKQENCTGTMKYIDNFSNPYVKIILVCRLCNKEQSTRNTYKWKRHFLSHSDRKPFPCSYCTKSFAEAYKLRTHMQSKHNDSCNPHMVKGESS